jgi:hypothetical protein
VFRWAARALAEFFKSRASLVAENLCLRQPLLVVLVGNPIRLASGGESGDAHAHGRCSHAAVVCAHRLISLKSAA